MCEGESELMISADEFNTKISYIVLAPYAMRTYSIYRLSVRIRYTMHTYTHVMVLATMISAICGIQTLGT